MLSEEKDAQGPVIGAAPYRILAEMPDPPLDIAITEFDDFDIWGDPENLDNFGIVPLKYHLTDRFRGPSGLYPHEILLLTYANSYYLGGSDFQLFWWNQYGVADVQEVLDSLMARGYLERCPIKPTLEKQTVARLKELLKSKHLPLSGKKADLVSRLLSEVPAEELESIYPRRTYARTMSGEAAIQAEQHVDRIHSHPISGLDIWSFTEILNKNTGDWKTIRWGYLNQYGIELAQAGDWGLYRNTRLELARILLDRPWNQAIDNDTHREALSMLAEVAFYDTSGLSNNWNEYSYELWIDSLVLVESTVNRVAPWVIEMIASCQRDLSLTNKQLREVLNTIATELSVPVHLFTPSEYVDVVMMELAGDGVSLEAIYELAVRRAQECFQQ